MNKPIAWTIAGLDPSGGAGIQTDILTMHALGAHPCPIITAMTAQNNENVNAIEFLSAEQLSAQIQALENTFAAKSIKIGMLGNINLVKQLIAFSQRYTGKIILDPILASSSGYSLVQDNLSDYLLELKKLLPFIYLLTPNLDEVKKLLNRDIETHDDIINAAEELLSFGVKNVLIKGGHFNNENFCQDYWTNGKEAFWLTSKRHDHIQVRGTGCALSSAITACLALNYDIKDALVISKMYINQGIRLSYPLNNTQHLHHHSWPENQMDLPWLSHVPMQSTPIPFSCCEQIGLYPIVDSTEWIEKLLPLGVKTIQLRIKNCSSSHIENEIQKAVRIANQYSAQLFINDYWELAIKYRAYGVHLGQEDILTADMETIQQSGLRLGLSTHCYYEVARAHALAPSYLACGPIFPTTSKIMPFEPQGLDNLKRWRRTLNYPLVAIGGINQNRYPLVQQTKVDGIAMISAITQAHNPTEIAKKLVNYDILSIPQS